MFDCYIRTVIEKNKLIFPEDFCLERLTKEDDNKKALDELQVELGPYLYAGNYYNNPLSDDLIEFKDEWFQHYKFDEVAQKLKPAKCIISIDPATRIKETNDPSGITITKVPDDGSVYVIESKAKKLLPHKLVDEVFTLVDIYDPDVVVIETVSAQIIFKDLFEFEMKKRKKFFRLEEYDPGTKETKAMKIRKLIPYYARGQVFHKPGLTELERQLREFPRNKNDDLIDSLQAQIPYWRGVAVSVTKPLAKYSVEWWDKLRRENRSSGDTAQEKLFEGYKQHNT